MNENDYINIVKGIINTANNSDPAYILNNGKYSISDFYTLINSDDFKKAGYNAVLNADGSVRTYTYTNSNGQVYNSGSDVDGGINSNTQTGTSSGTVEFTQPIDTTMTTATETEPSIVQSVGKMAKFTDGVKGVGNFVFGSVRPAIGAAATGIALGKLIDKGIYEVGTNVFGSDKLEAFNPDTWGTITAGDDSLGAKAFNTIFGINPDTGDTQMYLDENAFAYMTAYLNSIGAFSTSEYYENTDKYKDKFHYWDMVNGMKLYPVPNNLVIQTTNPDGTLDPNGPLTVTNNNPNTKTFLIKNPRINNYGVKIIIVGSNDEEAKINYTSYYSPGDGSVSIENAHAVGGFSQLGKIAEIGSGYYFGGTEKRGQIGYPLSSYSKSVSLNPWKNEDYELNDLLGVYLSSNFYSENELNGVSNQNDAKVFDPTNITDIASALNELKKQYPELWDNRVENSVVQPDGTTKIYTYIPVPMPTGGVGDRPTTPGASQDKPSVDPSDATDTLRKTIIKILTQPKPVGMVDTAVDPVNPNPPDTGSGKTPILTPPAGASNALYSIYNPTQSQLNSFGAWLWSSNFVDQILKVFSNPMQAIIGLHKVFAKPSISGTGNIKVGYLDSGVSSNIVGGQYTTVDCGSVNLYEYYGNVFDYDPYTKINLYLPFIGIVPLNTGEVMRSTIHVVYHIDVLTGACLAEVKIIRDMAGGTLYQYTGNAAVQYPISSGSYMGIVSGILSIAGGIAGTMATGGAAMPVLLGAGASVGRMHTDTAHSGGFSGNAGAMGIKKPYLIIDRPQSSLAKNFQNYVGYPSNSTVALSGCKGFTKVKEVHLENVPATNDELTDIETKLKVGVII